MKPDYQLKRVEEDSDDAMAEISSVSPFAGQNLTRRGLFASIVTAGAALIALTEPANADTAAQKKAKAKCKKKKGYKWDSNKKKCVKRSSSGGSYCSCNLVCTCDLVYY